MLPNVKLPGPVLLISVIWIRSPIASSPYKYNRLNPEAVALDEYASDGPIAEKDESLMEAVIDGV